MSDFLKDSSVPELLGHYASILAELRSRGVIRTANAPLGDYAEHVAHKVYGGTIAPNSERSYDIAALDGRLIQVKARTWNSAMSPSSVFSAFRTFGFDVAVFLVFDSATYELLWAREMTPVAVESAGRWSAHVNGYLLRVPLAQRLGTDVTEEFRSALAPG